MFHDLTPTMLARMAELEAIDAADRADGTPHGRRLRQIPPDTGRYLAILAASAPAGQMVEVGTSAGYSALWLSLACRERGGVLTSIDRDPDKLALARQTLETTGTADVVRLVCGDALEIVAGLDNVAFAFIDANRDVLAQCVELLADRLVPGGLLAADNVISHAAEIPGVAERILADPRFDAVVVPIGSGVLTARRTRA
ncbi:O-methyltransferase [Desulfovibrio sp. TomC]|uniref:O-methyltransferase n=1 Tax=Desulfovibrio sp. TomC TaxID=1562888 RepID=UPI0005738C7F|nr:class I SAM-dependent methyltransferase [Desulfovibrio sp. TomC]KHK02726.1 O-methyltransferase [Desulfovibrio sp. TomC]